MRAIISLSFRNEEIVIRRARASTPLCLHRYTFSGSTALDSSLKHTDDITT
jgi:hypothetical protein